MQPGPRRHRDPFRARPIAARIDRLAAPRDGIRRRPSDVRSGDVGRVLHGLRGATMPWAAPARLEVSNYVLLRHNGREADVPARQRVAAARQRAGGVLFIWENADDRSRRVDPERVDAI